MTRVLGIDPGVARVGFGAIDVERGGEARFIRCGMITTKPEQAFPERLHEVYNDLKKIVEEVKPQVVSCEKLYFQNNAKTALEVGQARGIVLLAAEQAGCRIEEFTPLQIKQAITGYGKAEKAQLADMVVKILKLDFVPKPDDVSDALAIALASAFTSRTDYA